MKKIEVPQIHLEGNRVLNHKVRFSREYEFELMQRVARGDLKAFEQIYWEHNCFVYSLCLKIIGNREEAEEITQNVFVRLFREIDGFENKGSFRFWLYRFTFNEVLRHFRKNKSRKNQTADDSQMTKLNKADGTKTTAIFRKLFASFSLY